MKHNLASMSGLSNESLHLCIGLALFGLTLLFLHNRHRLRLALLIVLIVALFNEFMDFRQVTAVDDPWDWFDSLRDIILSLLAPVVLMLVSRYWQRWHHRPYSFKLSQHT